MKIWTSEHTFQHPWETVTQAAWRKYPNPMNPAVEAIDIVDRSISNGVLKTHRLISSKWGLPSWASRLLGADKTCYASEHSEVNPTNKTMTLMTKNLTFCNEVSVVEKLTYSPHPSKEDCTLLKQEAVVTIRNVPLSSYIEDYLAKTISNNANKGRQAMEWVIGKINDEVHGLTQKTVKGMDELTVTAKKSISVVEDLTSSAKNDFNHFAEETLPNLHFEK
ncbi:protein slowmo-like [Uloborus diversus]|uniref:protein slowmo-like n=1 Tax=Uloborus diversus TaxID=327109 RepID=UPI002409C139|nr:protein slowmo-like [Uloborus diversus]XP_054719593.1 protein slowmo-like [Uloborus diversus]